MRRILPVLAVLLAWNGSVQAAGLLIPEEKTVPPLAMLNHKVSITIDDQVAVTKVEQTFRNHTSRQLEATYVFPVPKGASVNQFTMWVGGKEVKGELVEADKARRIYTSIVQQTRDPGLLEYMGSDLLRMRVFPIPPHGDQKVALSYTSVSRREKGVVEYVYPLKNDGKTLATLEEFSINAAIKSQHGVQNVYSPSHAITLKRRSDNEITVEFDEKQGLLDRDFQMFYQLGDKDVGLTALTHRPVAAENGYVLMLITPKVELKDEYRVPRDVVLVMDTSGSMRGEKMEQARKALKFCLDNLTSKDRFALINFATTVNKYRDKFTAVGQDQITQAKKWVDDLDATGGTAINDALAAALGMRTKDEGRTFTVVFFTDGLPTIGETNPDKILKSATAKNTLNTRVFTFGVGDDVNASLLDRLAAESRAVSTYVRPKEDIGDKVASLYSKIAHPVLANLKLTTTGDVGLAEVYPPQLPDLFHGSQLTVLARFTGKGASAIKLTGSVGKEQREFVYEMTFPDKTDDKKDFVEHLWARRKVGYLLDQIRANGEKKELVEEVTTLAKRYGITTPYTSYLIVPDGARPVVRHGDKTAPMPDVRFTAPGRSGAGAAVPPGLTTPSGGPKATPKPTSVEDFAKRVQQGPGGVYGNRGRWADKDFARLPKDGKSGDKGGYYYKALDEARDKKAAYDHARELLRRNAERKTQEGALGVELSVQTANLRNQARLLGRTALRNVQNRNCVEIGGVWIDEGFTGKTRTVTVKAQSKAYFRILEKHPEIKDVYTLGNYLVWITPSGTALVIDGKNGVEEMKDAEIDKLFVAKK